ncbi:G20.3 [Klebsiella michiganensis]|uniref:G20.3 n=1 Tax=Klebsiella michiganensis TaxID=1134687 RepID=A0A7H4LV56_9ENTR|nr:G20.3 [Klebsiella michiganensis]
MKYQLTAHEARVIGCLLEKQVTTRSSTPCRSTRWSPPVTRKQTVNR